MEPLTPRERFILKARCLDRRTLADIAVEIQISPYRIRQYTERGLGKLGLDDNKTPEFTEAIRAALND